MPLKPTLLLIRHLNAVLDFNSAAVVFRMVPSHRIGQLSIRPLVMRAISLTTYGLVAAAIASACIFGEVVGCVFVLGLGVTALIFSHRRRSTEAAAWPNPSLRQFAPWGVCILLYIAFVLLLAPFASLPAVVAALLILSPLFGTMVLLTSSALSDLTRCLLQSFQSSRS